MKRENAGSASPKRAESIVVSACLLGEACRYDGKSQPCDAVLSLVNIYELVPVCPEQLGGLPTPRTPSEVQRDGRVVDRSGIDRTAEFELGARETLALAREHNCTRAILKAKSPSCGTREIYDGSFSGTLIPGQGITARALRTAGIALADETNFESLLAK